MAHPDWALKFRRPGTELRRKTESLYCLYECSSVYDKQKKRARKVTGKYLGSITEEGGFKPSKKRLLEQELAAAKEEGASGVHSEEIGRLKQAVAELWARLEAAEQRLAALEEAEKKT